MSTIPPARGKSWIYQITALCIVLGMLLAFSLKTQRQAVDEGLPIRLPALRAEFRATKQQNIELQKQIADYKERVEELEEAQASGVDSASGLRDSLRLARMMAGMVAVRGPGVVVSLHDSPKLNPSETRPEIIEDYMVHDTDIKDVVSELFAAGAEAIAVNGQRLVANSSIRCVGPVVLVNSVQIAPPYEIAAIGKPEVLENALEMPGGVADVNGLLLLDMIEIKKEATPVIKVPAFTGAPRFAVAREIEEAKTNKQR